jgi:hypothetical protein
VLAYVFWHAPAEGVEREGYERAQVAFHRALAADPPEGFEWSVCHRFPELPWLGDGPGYEDWYLTTDWTTLGALERGAVSGPRRESHDRAAALSAKGAGAVYGLVDGSAGALAAGTRVWRDRRPEGGSGGLWRRRLVLGPAPEHCLAGGDADGPDGLQTEGERIFSR